MHNGPGTPKIVSGKTPGVHWSDKTKIKVVKDWLKTGSLADACRKNKVPYFTVLDWKRTTWWKELVERYREEIDLRSSSTIDDIVVLSFDAIKDRLENGEHIIDSKTGEVIRVPTKSRDLAHITKILSDRQDILIKRKKVEDNDTQSIKEKLTDLASHFSSFVKQTNVKAPDIVDGSFTMLNETEEEVVDAVHITEWEEGL